MDVRMMMHQTTILFVLVVVVLWCCCCCVEPVVAFHLPPPASTTPPAAALLRPSITTTTKRLDVLLTTPSSSSSLLLQARNTNRRYYDDDDDDNDEDDEYYDDDDDDDEYYDNLGDFSERRGLDLPSSFGRRDGWRLPESVSKALLAGVFVLGVGLGVTVDSQVNTNPKDLASRDAIDNAAPNSVLCAKLGASAMAFDQRVFVSFNPFNVYVAQADVKPACVLKQANVVPVLRAKGFINDDEVRACKQNMNTWAFVGDLQDKPQLSCVYKSKDAQNEFLSNPKYGIGEDYLDDDREYEMERMARTNAAGASGKIVKGGMTQGQAQMKQAGSTPQFDFPIF